MVGKHYPVRSVPLFVHYLIECEPMFSLCCLWDGDKSKSLKVETHSRQSDKLELYFREGDNYVEVKDGHCHYHADMSTMLVCNGLLYQPVCLAWEHVVHLTLRTLEPETRQWHINHINRTGTLGVSLCSYHSNDIWANNARVKDTQTVV